MATIVTRPGMDPVKVAERLHDAMAGAGTDEAVLVDVFAGHSNAQLQEIRQAFKSAFGSDLVEKVESETSGHFRRACVALLKERTQLRADLLHEALAGAGTDIQQLVDVLAVMSADEVEVVKERFKATYEKELEKEVRGDTSGNNEKTLVAILAAGRPADAAVDDDKAREEAQELYEKGEGKAGTDNAYFRAIFCTRSWAQLGATLKVFGAGRGVTKKGES